MFRKRRFLDTARSLILHKETIAVISILITALCLRLYHLGFHDLWYDEIGSLKYAEHPWNNWNAPFYWILLHFWIKIFGISEFSLRLPSLIFSFLSVIGIYLLGKALFNRKVGIWASIFTALSPFQLWYAQEARDYSMALFFGTLSTYIFCVAIKENAFKLWLYFTLVSIIGLYTSYFYIFLIMAQGLFLMLIKKNRISLKEISPFLIICIGFGLYLPKFLNKFYFIWQGFWLSKPTLVSMRISLENFILGYNAPHWLYIISDVLVALLFIIALKALLKKDLKTSFILCLFLFLIPIICAFIFSKLFFSIYLDRGFIIFTPYLYLVLALGLILLPRIIKWALFCFLFSVLLLADYNFLKDLMPSALYHHVGIHLKKPIKPIVKFLQDNTESDDIISFTNQSAMPSIIFYLKEKNNRFYFFFNPSLTEECWRRPRTESEFMIPWQKISSLNAKRIWVIASTWERNGTLDQNYLIAKNWLDKEFKLEFNKEFDGLWLFRYTKIE